MFTNINIMFTFRNFRPTHFYTIPQFIASRDAMIYTIQVISTLLFILANTMAEPSLQALFQHVFVTQSFLHQLQNAEEFLSDISDHLDEYEIPHEDVYMQIRTGIRQMRIHLSFLLAIQLLEVCRRLERHMQVHGRLPNLDLNFQ